MVRSCRAATARPRPTQAQALASQQQQVHRRGLAALRLQKAHCQTASRGLPPGTGIQLCARGTSHTLLHMLLHMLPNACIALAAPAGCSRRHITEPAQIQHAPPPGCNACLPLICEAASPTPKTCDGLRAASFGRALLALAARGAARRGWRAATAHRPLRSGPSS